ncbi:caspase family protein [Calothrix rhizosoleniae]|uniref:caspase family protein n=1 Tax=Calothrix rhizosoleniae TaxID=888997 RepID=UPI000B49E508|nr:caspase domain-containing protein [Calothrix rhizosoleniae]
MSFLSTIKYLVITSLLLPFIFVLPTHKSTSTTKHKIISLDRYKTNRIKNIIAQNNSPVKLEKRTALIIGNADYKIAGMLKNPINDAQDIAKNLRELGFDVTILTDLSLQQMEQAIENFNRQLRQGGVGLFYFAGHGVQVEGENYLVPVEATLERGQNVRYEAYPVGKLLGAIEDARNKANIVILDACRNNPFTRSWRSSSRGLAPPAQTVQGVLIAYSTAPGKVAFDGKGNNSPYTSAILRHIKTPRLDVEQMFKRVRRDVLQTTKGKQTPWESSSLVGKFSFNLENKGKTDEIATTVTQPVVTPSMVDVPSPSPENTTQPKPNTSTNTSVTTAYFIQPPRLTYLGATSNLVSVPSTTYYSTK